MKDFAIIGGGISGLSCGYFLRQYNPDLSICILEGSDRLGGSIHSFHLPSGQLYESGPKTLRLYGKSGIVAIELLSQLGLKKSCIKTSSAAKHRYILHDQKPLELPSSLFSALRSPLGRHLLKKTIIEPFQKPIDDFDESVASFFARRAPSTIVNKLVDALCSGIWGGNPQTLSIYATLPELKEFETTYGSVVLGGLHSLFRRKEKPKMTGIYGLQHGLTSLIAALSKTMADCITIKTPITSIMKKKDFFILTSSDGNKIEAKKIILAIPYGKMRQLYPELFVFPIVETSFATVVVGYQKQIPHIPGYGILAPSTEDSRVLGILFDSSTFPQKNTSMQTRFSIILGGDRYRSVLNHSDEELFHIATTAVSSWLHIKTPCDEYGVIRSPFAIPHPPVGSHRLKPFFESNCKSLYAIGPSIGGVSVTNCIASAHALSLHTLSESVSGNSYTAF